MNKSEEWRDIPDYEGFYQVSSLGRVYSVARIVPGKGGYPRKAGGRFISRNPPRDNSHGHSVVLCRDGGRKDWAVSMLLARAFLGIPQPGYVAAHKIGFDDVLENIEWVRDVRHFNKIALKSGFFKTRENNHRFKYSDTFITAIKARAMAGERQIDIAHTAGIDKQIVWEMVHDRYRARIICESVRRKTKREAELAI